MLTLGSHLVARAGSLLPAVPARSVMTTTPLLTAIGGEKARQRLHALHPAHPGQEAATAGFAIALALSLQRARDAPLLWVQDRQATAEAGRPYGHGLAALGFDPARLVVVAVKGAMNALAAAEMGLEEAGLAGVLVDLPPRLPSDMLRLGKRLSLRAQARETPCFLLHAGREPVEAPVATRWSVQSGRRQQAAGSRISQLPDLRTAFDLTLTKNRFGGLGRFSVAWRPVASIASPNEFNHAIPEFVFSDTTLSEPVAASAANRSAGTGAVLPWPAAAA